ncbi:MAG TPA: hypothetical protein VIO60_05490 [Rectinemataceae bacterium]
MASRGAGRIFLISVVYSGVLFIAVNRDFLYLQGKPAFFFVSAGRIAVLLVVAAALSAFIRKDARRFELLASIGLVSSLALDLLVILTRPRTQSSGLYVSLFLLASGFFLPLESASFKRFVLSAYSVGFSALVFLYKEIPLLDQILFFILVLAANLLGSTLLSRPAAFPKASASSASPPSAERPSRPASASLTTVSVESTPC